MLTLLQRHILKMLEEVARGYAWIALLPSWTAGALLALLTFTQPVIGAIGLVGAISAWYAAHIAGADAGERPVCVFNGLLSGLFLAHVWVAGLGVIALTLLGGIFSGWLTVVLGRLSWSLVRVPILSFPFAIVAMLTLAASGSLTTLRPSLYDAPLDLFGTQADKFLAAIGNLYFMPIPLIGLAIVIVMLLYSRYYLVLALVGYGAAWLWFKMLGAAPEHLANTAWDSNAILAALLVGGLFATPSWTTAALATMAAVMSAWLALALGRIFDAAHLVPFSIPFILAAWLVLYAAVHNIRISSLFNLLVPDFPERSFERTQVSKSRVGKPGSVPLALPFMGLWTVSQGVSGAYTHRGIWRHALDFIVIKQGKSFAGQGQHLEDFYAYNLPVLSPAFGQVWRVVNDVPDNTPGRVNVAANWGNFVTIKLADGKFVLLAHLVPGSVAVLPGAWVKPGDVVGKCGNSGRSPQPHIHLHVQTGDEPGSATTPFHLASVMVADHKQAARYELAVVPKEQASLMSAASGEVRPFYLLAGRGLRYTVVKNEAVNADWTLHCEVDELGRLVLISSGGGRCFAESTWAVFSCFERHGSADPYFDLWLLACGFSPVSFQVESWQDHKVPARLMPNWVARGLAHVLWPWAAFARGDYQRQWDEKAQAWRLQSNHLQKLSGIQIKTEALIAPQLGCSHMTAKVGAARYTLQATSSFQKADIGVPAWEVPLSVPTAMVRPV